jgi:DNA polymerase III subunit beta
MFFEIERDVLLDGLVKAVPITEKKSSLPILSHLLIEAAESQLVMTATDLAVGLRIQYDCEIRDPGRVAVPCRKMFEIVKELSPGRVSVELSDSGRIRLCSGQSVFELASMEASDYPAWASFEEVKTAPIQAEQLLIMIEKTLFASSNDESRFNLNGVLFEQDEEKIKLVATDGHRLAMISEDLGMSIPDKRVVVAKKSLLELKRMLESLKEEITLGFEPKNLFIKTDRLMMTIRLTDGDYPDYRKVIPEPSNRKLIADRLRLAQMLRRVAILTSDRNKGVTLEMKSGTMILTAVHPDLGTARDVIDVEYSGEDLSLVVNVSYLMESVSAVDGETLSFEFHDEGEPIIVKPEPPKNYFNLVMPMRK